MSLPTPIHNMPEGSYPVFLDSFNRTGLIHQVNNIPEITQTIITYGNIDLNEGAMEYFDQSEDYASEDDDNNYGSDDGNETNNNSKENTTEMMNEISESTLNINIDKAYYEQKFGNYGCIDDENNDSGSKTGTQREWIFKEGAINECDVNDFINNCEKTKFIDVEDKDPVSIFKHFLSEEIMQLLVINTNAKAKEEYIKFNFNHSLDKNYVPLEWKDTTIKEMNAFIGVLIYVGCMRYHTTIKNLFSKKNGLPFVRVCFSRERFSQINRFPQYDVKEERHSYEEQPFRIVQNMLKILQNNFLKAATPSEIVTIDERMCGYRGKPPIRIYMPNKPDKFGMIFHCLVDYNSKYCYGIRLYLGKTNDTIRGHFGEYMVKQLVKMLPSNRHFILACDQLFTTYKFMQ